MTSLQPKTAKENAEWFGRADAFSFLDRDEDNVLRVEVVRRLLRAPGAGRRLLDIGCGDGRVGAGLAGLGYQVTGIDASSEALDLAAQRGLTPLRGDVSDGIPAASGSFDVVYAGEIIEHLFDTHGFLQEVRRVLVPGGKLLLTTPNLAHLPDRLRLLLGRAPTQVQPMHPFLKLHIRPFTAGTLQHALETSDFALRRLQSTLVVFRRDSQDPDRVLLASRWLARFAPRLGSFLIALAQRSS